jgi:hypothetical protein
MFLLQQVEGNFTVMLFTLDGYCAQFAETWANGDEHTAVGMARNAAERWEQLYLADTIERFRNTDLIWPNPGRPEADEAVGWTGWFGEDYNGTGV